MAVRDSVRFYLNESPVTLSEVSPQQTVLEFLRRDCALTGTKEGCAEGDCGACTVLVGRLGRDEALVYEPVNACIRFVASLHATHVVTIEALAPSHDRLHPVQQAMLEKHGSQCGFCTPGIVMALYGHWLCGGKVDGASIDRALQGNLCRCTGYAPIVRAAESISDYGTVEDDPLTVGREAMTGKLLELHHDDRIEVGADGRRAVLPATVDDLAEAVETMPDATLVAGCTDVSLWVTKSMRDLSTIVFLNRVSGMREVGVDQDRIVIGAAVSLSEAEPIIVRHIPQLKELLSRFGGEQVRNMGTIGGNIANGSPIGDLPPALIALGTTITLRKGQDHRMIRLEDFFVAYGRQDIRKGEFLVSIAVPLPAEGDRFAAYKVTKRFDEDISAVMGAFRLEVDNRGTVSNVVIAYGGMAGTPMRARHVEAALLRRPWSRATVETAMAAYANDFSPISDWRASAAYRMLVAKNLLLRFWAETTGIESVRLASADHG
jgi:xanthine dehydrogenase small subunit